MFKPGEQSLKILRTIIKKGSSFPEMRTKLASLALHWLCLTRVNKWSQLKSKKMLLSVYSFRFLWVQTYVQTSSTSWYIFPVSVPLSVHAHFRHSGLEGCNKAVPVITHNAAWGTSLAWGVKGYETMLRLMLFNMVSSCLSAHLPVCLCLIWHLFEICCCILNLWLVYGNFIHIHVIALSSQASLSSLTHFMSSAFGQGGFLPSIKRFKIVYRKTFAHS